MKPEIITGKYVDDIATYMLDGRDYVYLLKDEYEFFLSNAQMGAYVYYPVKMDGRNGFFCKPKVAPDSKIYHARESISHEYKLSMIDSFPSYSLITVNVNYRKRWGFMKSIDVVLGEYKIQGLKNEINDIESKSRIVSKHSPILNEELVKLQLNKRDKIHNIYKRIQKAHKESTPPIIEPTIL